MTHPYAVPDQMTPDLTRVLAYWQGLRRGEAQMPFWDDARLTDLPDLRDRLFLIDVFVGPERFRLGEVGEAVAKGGSPGWFLDEVELGAPLDFLRSQASATVECAAPTLFTQKGESGRQGYARLLLPMWGDGRIGMLLGAVA